MRRNILVYRKCLLVISRSRNTKRSSKGVSRSRENGEILCSCTGCGEESCARNRRLRFAPRNVLGLCRCLLVLNRSGKSKRDLKGVGGCLENWEILSWPLSALSIGEESHARNRQPRFAPRNVFGLCRCLQVSLRSRITKKISKGVSRSRDNWEKQQRPSGLLHAGHEHSISQFSR